MKEAVYKCSSLSSKSVMAWIREHTQTSLIKEGFKGNTQCRSQKRNVKAVRQLEMQVIAGRPEGGPEIIFIRMYGVQVLLAGDINDVYTLVASPNYMQFCTSALKHTVLDANPALVTDPPPSSVMPLTASCELVDVEPLAVALTSTPEASSVRRLAEVVKVT